MRTSQVESPCGLPPFPACGVLLDLGGVQVQASLAGIWWTLREAQFQWPKDFDEHLKSLLKNLPGLGKRTENVTIPLV